MQQNGTPSNQNGMDEGLAQVIKAINRFHQAATITAVAGNCPYGHREGEKFTVTTMNSDGLCGSLYQAIHPAIATLEYEGGLLWEKQGGRFLASCPDPYDLLSYRLTREKR